MADEPLEPIDPLKYSLLEPIDPLKYSRLDPVSDSSSTLLPIIESSPLKPTLETTPLLDFSPL